MIEKAVFGTLIRNPFSPSSPGGKGRTGEGPRQARAERTGRLETIRTSSILAAALFVALLPGQVAGETKTWFSKFGEVREAQATAIRTCLGMTGPQLEAEFGLTSDSRALAVEEPEARRAELTGKLKAYTGPAQLLRAHCLSLLAPAGSAEAVRLVKEAAGDPAWVPSLSFCYGLRADQAGRTLVADAWYEKGFAAFARLGMRMDLSWPLVTSPAIWLIRAGEEAAQRRDERRVEQIYGLLCRAGKNVEGLELLHFKAAAFFENHGAAEQAREARDRGTARYDDPNVMIPRYEVLLIDVGLLAGCGSLCLLLLLLTILEFKYRRIRRQFVRRRLPQAGRWARALSWAIWPAWRFASRVELAAIALACLTAAGGFITAVGEISMFGRITAAPIALLSGHWADPEVEAYLAKAREKVGEPNKGVVIGGMLSSIFSRVWEGGGDPASVAYATAYRELAMGRADSAAAQLRGLVGGPAAGDAEAWLNLGTALERAGRDAEARQAWRKSSELGCGWAAFNLDGSRPSAAPDDAIAALAAVSRPGDLAIPPGPERLAAIVRGARDLASSRNLSFLANAFSMTAALDPLPWPVAAGGLAALWVLAVSGAGMAWPRRLRTCVCGRFFEVTSPDRITCGECPVEEWGDTEFLMESPEPLTRFMSRHLLALAVPGLKQSLRGPAVVGVPLLAALVYGLVANGMLSMARDEGGMGIGLISAVATPNLFRPMFGDAYSIAWEPFIAFYLGAVGALLPLAYGLNALWLAGEWRRRR